MALQRRNNHETRAAWDLFAGHREKVTALALQGRQGRQGGQGGDERLAILGAGNCNDIDLGAVTGHFGDVHLVDVDDTALRRARSCQTPEVASRLTLHAPVDVSGVMTRVQRFRDRPPTPAQLGSLAQLGCEAVRAAVSGDLSGALPRSFGTVLSAGVLSQLMNSCEVALGRGHALLGTTAYFVAVAHVRALVSLLAPGGTGILVTDVVSSHTFPVDELAGDWDPLALLDHLERTSNVLSGTEPAFLRAILTRDEVIGPALHNLRLVPPWPWRLSQDLTLLAYAWLFDKRA